MDDMPNIFLGRLEGRLSNIAYELTRIGLSWARWQGSWSPAINAYRCREGFVICVDLAGVDRSHIDLSVEPRRVSIRGRRLPPEPLETEGPPLQVLALEIDHGPFEREIVLLEEIEPNEVQAEQRNGLLWIHLPLHLSE
jgi:HSP20 family protein